MPRHPNVLRRSTSCSTHALAAARDDQLPLMAWGSMAGPQIASAALMSSMVQGLFLIKLNCTVVLRSFAAGSIIVGTTLAFGPALVGLVVLLGLFHEKPPCWWNAKIAATTGRAWWHDVFG